MRNPPAGQIVLPLGYKKYPVVYWTMYTTGYFGRKSKDDR